jgi:hypothetical protein
MDIKVFLINTSLPFHGYQLIPFFDFMIEWLIDWCLTSSEQFFIYIQDENI